MSKRYTISELAKLFSLSRSTLLYYDKKKIFQPSMRGDNDYRFYSEKDYETLKKICTLKEVGIPLKQIVQIIQHKETALTEILNQRLIEINEEIHRLRDHQRQIVSILGEKQLLNTTKSMNKETWVELLRSAGLDDAGMDKWHEEFEKQAPHAHQDFLQSIGLSFSQIKALREKYKSRR